MPRAAEPTSQGAGPRRRAVTHHLPVWLSASVSSSSSSPSAPSRGRGFVLEGKGTRLWLQRLFFTLGTRDGAWVQVCVARTPAGPGLSRALGPRPLLRHELTHPGISTPFPRLCPSQVPLSTPRGATRLATRVWHSRCSCDCIPQVLWEYPGGVLGGTQRNPPQPGWICGGS